MASRNSCATPALRFYLWINRVNCLMHVGYYVMRFRISSLFQTLVSDVISDWTHWKHREWNVIKSYYYGGGSPCIIILLRSNVVSAVHLSRGDYIYGPWFLYEPCVAYQEYPIIISASRHHWQTAYAVWHLTEFCCLKAHAFSVRTAVYCVHSFSVS